MQNQEQQKQDEKKKLVRRLNIAKLMLIKLKEGLLNKNDLIDMARIWSDSMLSTYWNLLIQFSFDNEWPNNSSLERQIENIESQIIDPKSKIHI